MTDPQPASDPLLMLIQRLSETQIEQGRAQIQQTADSHSIRLLLAEINGDLKPLKSLSTDLAIMREKTDALRITVTGQQATVTRHETAIAGLEICVDTLKTASDKRSGWEGFGGKLIYLLGGALITAAVTLLVLR